MSSPGIHQPHDGLIRYTFGTTENAASLFQAHLPPGVVAALNWEKMKLESGSYVDEGLRRSESDLLYSVPAGESGEKVLVYLLFEHQSTSDRWLPLRLLGYMTRIWQKQRKENQDASGLPPILPMVLSQVKGGWNVSIEFSDLLLWPKSIGDELRSLQPRFSHLLIDLDKVSNEQLQGNPAARLAQGLLKAAMEGDLEHWLEWAAPELRRVRARDFLYALLLYAANAESELDLPRFVKRIQSSEIPHAAETIMSIAERIRKEGEERGLARGTLIGRIQALQGILGRPESTPETLEALGAEQLRTMIAELERALR